MQYGHVCLSVAGSGVRAALVSGLPRLTQLLRDLVRRLGKLGDMQTYVLLLLVPC